MRTRPVRARACGLIGLPLHAGLRAVPAREGRAGDRGDEALSAQYPRYGYRRIRIFLRRKGTEWPASGPSPLAPSGPAAARRRPGAASPAAGRGPCPPANQVWAYDFVFDASANGQQIKCLTVVDEYTRECLAIDVAGSIRSKRVIEVLSRLVSMHGAPLLPALRQRSGVRQPRDPRVADRGRHRHRADRSGQALAKRHRRELQRQDSATSA